MDTQQISVLVVDDSAVVRELLRMILSRDRAIRVVGEAANGQEALSKVQALRPDVVTMDIDMPIMNGLEAIERIMASHAVPILVVTAQENSETAYAAIAKGALELVEKPDINPENAKGFIEKIKLLSKVKVIRHLSPKQKAKSQRREPEYGATSHTDAAIAIAVSTGGPKALSTLLPVLPEDFPYPVLIAQHMSDGFIRGLVEWLDSLSKLPVREGVAHDIITPGIIYISPSEKHMEITPGGKIALQDRQPNDIYHPSCDMLLSSVARVYRANSVGIILTGMGDDGVLGIQKIKEYGGMTIAQDEKTSVVFGMPKMAIRNGFIDKTLSLDRISNELMHIASIKKYGV